MNKAAIYCRVSTEEQRERETIKTQTESAENYCRRQSLAIHDFYMDDGISGTIPFEGRPAGARLLEDARRGLFDTLVIYKVDRLGRDVIVTLTALRQIHALGVTIISATEVLDLSTPAGWAMAAVISAFGQLERENFLARSWEATERLAREGAWLGGIVPYGYRVQGKGREARLVLSEETIPGTDFSEVGVMRLVYDLLTQERRSCFYIAERLNALGIPPSYTRDGRLLTQGKRREKTQGIWRMGRIYNMVVSTTYMGVHRYGKRSQKKEREVIAREVPALVSPEQWGKAQEVLRSNMICSRKNAKRQYLLRGLIKCGVCGLTYSGTAYPRASGEEKIYYTCGGKIAHRAHYGTTGHRCTAKAVGGVIETLIWNDIEGFLCAPGEVLAQLEAAAPEEEGRGARLQGELALMERALAAKVGESDKLLGLYRKGIIGEEELTGQLEQVRREEAALQEDVQRLRAQGESARSTQETLRSAATLLEELHARLDGPLPPEVKRRVVECLVGSIRVDTAEEGSRQQAIVTVSYRFDRPLVEGFTPAANCTDTDSSKRQVETAPETKAFAPRAKS